MTKLLQQCLLYFIVVVIPGHNLGNIQVSVNRTIGPTLVYVMSSSIISLLLNFKKGWVGNDTKSENSKPHLDLGQDLTKGTLWQ